MAQGYVLAEFRDEALLLAAARTLRERGRRGLDICSPYPLHGADEALGLRRSPVPLIALVAGVSGAVGGFLMQWWMNAVSFPLNVGNRGPFSPPANIPITFECGVLLASLAIVLGLFALCGFPRTYHPLFEVEAFRTASVDGLWLAAEAEPQDQDAVAQELARLGAAQVSRVPAPEGER
jgi:hypothetical protein